MNSHCICHVIICSTEDRFCWVRNTLETFCAFRNSIHLRAKHSEKNRILHFSKTASYSLLPSWLALENSPTAPLQRDKTLPNECPGYDTKQSDGEVPVITGLWGMLSTPSLPLLPDHLCPGQKI